MTGIGRPDVDDVAYEQLRQRFRPVFERIAAGAVERERGRELPFEQVKWLKAARFGAVRLPVADGGGGASVSQLFDLLIELGEADSNLPQILRAHFGFVEERLYEPDSDQRDRWLSAVADGAIIGNATTEIGDGALGTVRTTLDGADGAELWSLNGTKHYSTGSLFADGVFVFARRGERLGFAVVSTAATGVTQSDNWAGFGQQMTGSGTTVLEDVSVDPSDVFWYSDETPSYIIAFYQLVLLASLAGIGRAVARDAAEYVRGRRRVFSNGSGDSAREDPLVQQIIGQLSALSFSVDATVRSAAAGLERINSIHQAGNAPTRADFDAAETSVSLAQGTVGDSVLKAATLLFDVGGSSSVDQDRALDRHWRNARTICVHNPTMYKVRSVGDTVLNDQAPTYAWVVGAPRSDQG
ncbi:acyl-CoA dehydrogenase family protein [Rhodococcus globerulus]|uniref:Acyl-CoA dehydrogenase family protein n=1 Tax=Rhodococcus globerulus TaxID=33008 RepID=A0ABU4C3A6_RHOGO|nr:acyl-CoA dehydrogenase family protein [Rhodococcus globerulus]MDV6270981.1 acyl-CoA dehydrogenase family protein [Rhodococcus globerulus]